MNSERSLLAPFRLRAVHIGVQATLLVVVLGTLYAALPGHGSLEVAPFAAVLAVALIGGAAVWILPWKRLLDAGKEMAFFYSWSITDIALISFAIAWSGGASSDVYMVYLLTTIYFGALYPPRAQLLLLLYTWAAYLAAITATGWGIGAAALVLRLGAIGVLAFIGRFLTGELMHHLKAHGEARDEAARRAALLATVAQAGRGMSSLEADRVLATVVDSAIGLGFDVACLCVFQEETQTFRVEYARGLPDEFSAALHDGGDSLPGLARQRRETVRLEEIAELRPDVAAGLRAAGFEVAVAVPVWSQGEVHAVLGAASRGARRLAEPDVEALELLAGQAGAALDNARRFEEEHEMVERLAELDRLKQNFVSTVSHEFRTPLAVIRGMSRTLSQRWAELDDDVRAELLERMNSNVEALDQIIATLLDFSLLEAGRLEAHLRPVDVRELVEKCIRRLGTLLAGHRVSVDGRDRPTALADPMLVDRVLENLLSNAVKYTSLQTRVVLSVAEEGDRVRVVVADEGPGIAPEDVAHLGQRFFRGGDPNSRPRGTGLGLALVREVCDLHGGKLEVDSEIGRGARFSFTLPRLSRNPFEDQTRVTV